MLPEPFMPPTSEMDETHRYLAESGLLELG